MDWHQHSTTKTDTLFYNFHFLYIFAHLLEDPKSVFWHEHCFRLPNLWKHLYNSIVHTVSNSAMAEVETVMSSIFCLFFTVWAPWSECWENGSDVSGVCELVAVSVCLPSQQIKSNNTSARTDKLPRINVSIYLLISLTTPNQKKLGQYGKHK